MANMDLWYRTMGLFMQIKCKYYSEIPIKIPKNNHKCPMGLYQTNHSMTIYKYNMYQKASKHFQKLTRHSNQSVNSLWLYPEERRVKRKWPQDLQET